jgi:hypothetical protein
MYYLRRTECKVPDNFLNVSVTNLKTVAKYSDLTRNQIGAIGIDFGVCSNNRGTRTLVQFLIVTVEGLEY